ncbi:MAG: DUF429 domain-containing protein [Aquabacterium sp.]
MPLPTALMGLDFSCAPSKRKPLTLAVGRRDGSVLRLDRLDTIQTLDAWAEQLSSPGEGFVMGCDFPFGLPRAFVEALKQHGPGELPQTLSQPLTAEVPSEAARLIRALHQHCSDRSGFQRLVDGWGQSWHTEGPGAPVAGRKLLHRRTDGAMPGVSSTSPLQTHYVPVGKMYFEGLHRLIEADITLPGLHPGRPDAVALEAYPGLLAHEVLGRRSYKTDAAANTEAQQTRLIARMDLVDALEQGRTRLGLRLKLSPAQRDHLVADPMGDRLDAVLCLLQVAWAHQQAEAGSPCWGLPAEVDPVEGWILSA